MRKTTKMIEGGHRGLQESIGIYVITSTVFSFFQNPKSREFLPRDAVWCKARYCDRMSSVCPSVCLSVTLVNCDHIGWNSSEIISPLVSLGCSLFATPT